MYVAAPSRDGNASKVVWAAAKTRSEYLLCTLKVSSITLAHNEADVALPALEATDDSKSLRVALPDSLGLGAGTYKVAWATAGDDEHVVKGSFSYTVSASESQSGGRR